MTNNNNKSVKEWNHPTECLNEYKRVRPWFLQALASHPDGTTESDIIMRLADRSLYLYTTGNAAILVEYLTDEYSERWLNVFLTGGEKNNSIETINNAFDILFQLADRYEFHSILGHGRAGWKKILEPRGFATTKLENNHYEYKLRRHKEAPINNKVGTDGRYIRKEN